MSVLSELRAVLRENADEKLRESGKRYFKEAVEMYGTKTAWVEKLAKEYFLKVKPLGKKKIWELCEELWKSGYMEESFIAANWAYSLRKEFTIEDWPIFKRWVEAYVSNWAACDTFCNHPLAALVEKYPELINELKEWTKSENRWVKRASAVTLILPARHGQFLPDVFEIADSLLLDRDDMVQKGYGWMLKAASEAYQRQVFDYVMRKKSAMPRTSLRYAIEKMPPELRQQAMAK